MNKVLPGQTLKIPASTFNTMIDAAADYQRRRMNRAADVVPLDTRNGIITVRNSSGADCDRFEVLGLDDVLIPPSDNLQEFLSRFCFDAVLPESDHAKKFVVLQEPIRSGALGRAMVVGVTPVILKSAAGDTSEKAGIEAGETYLKTGIQGAQILWQDDFTADELHYGVVRLAADGGGSEDVSARHATTAALTPIAATDTTLTFASAPSVDGYVPVVGSIVLVKNQSGTGTFGLKRNGVYKVGDNFVWTREGTLVSGMMVSVRMGSRNAGNIFVLTTEAPIVIGTSYITFTNRNYAEFMTVLAADVQLNATMDTISIPYYSMVLLLQPWNSYVPGVYYRNSDSTWNFEATPLSVAVRQGKDYGQMCLFANSSLNGYLKSHAVWA